MMVEAASQSHVDQHENTIAEPTLYFQDIQLERSILVSSQKVGARGGRERRVSVETHSFSAHLMPVPSNIEKIRILD